MQVHVVSQPLPVCILMSTDVTLVRLGILMRPLVSGHGRGCVRAEATSSTHVGSLIGVFESYVFIQS